MPENEILLTSHDGIWFGLLFDRANHLRATAFNEDRSRLVKSLHRHDPEVSSVFASDHEVLKRMVELYEGNGLRDVPSLEMSGVSEFQRSVYRVLLSIPTGKVTQYGLIAKAIRSGPRAVGTAVASNPWPLIVPCHRVVPSSMRAGNYSLEGHPTGHGSEVKRQLLEKEGVRFTGESVDRSCLWTPRR